MIQYWKLWGICFGIVMLLASVHFFQEDLVVTHLVSDSYNDLSETAWIFGKYSSGKVVHARQCLDVAQGWKALMPSWPFTITLTLFSLAAGITSNYALKDKKAAELNKQKLSVLENSCQTCIEMAKKKYRLAELWEISFRIQSKEVDKKEAAVSRREIAVAEKEQVIEKLLEEKEQVFNKRLQSLQDDHKNRCHKMECLEKEKFELKRKNISLEKEIIKLQEENIALTKASMDLKRN